MKEITKKIELELTYPEFDKFEDVKKGVENKDVMDSREEQVTILEVLDAMDEAERKFKEEVALQLAEFKEKKEQVQAVKVAAGAKWLERYEDTKVLTKKVNKETGETTVKITHGLPKGVVVTKGRVSYDIDETKEIPDKFFKKTPKKKDIQNAVSTGELPHTVLIPKTGKPSVSLRLEDMKKVLKAKEDSLWEKAEEEWYKTHLDDSEMTEEFFEGFIKLLKENNGN